MPPVQSGTLVNQSFRIRAAGPRRCRYTAPGRMSAGGGADAISGVLPLCGGRRLCRRGTCGKFRPARLRRAVALRRRGEIRLGFGGDGIALCGADILMRNAWRGRPRPSAVADLAWAFSHDRRGLEPVVGIGAARFDPETLTEPRRPTATKHRSLSLWAPVIMVLTPVCHAQALTCRLSARHLVNRSSHLLGIACVACVGNQSLWPRGWH